MNINAIANAVDAVNDARAATGRAIDSVSLVVYLAGGAFTGAGTVGAPNAYKDLPRWL